MGTSQQRYSPRGDDRAPAVQHMFERPDLDPSKTAVVVIDMINRCLVRGVGMMKGMEADGVHIDDFLDRTYGTVVPNLRRLLDTSRAAGLRVVFVNGGCYAPDFSDCVPQMRTNYREWNALVGTWDMAVISEIEMAPSDMTVIKAASGGFASELDVRLRNMGVEQVIYVGVVTTGCVFLTVTAGFDLGYHGWLVADCTATFSDRLQDMAEELISSFMAKVVTADEMIALIEATGARPLASVAESALT